MLLIFGIAAELRASEIERRMPLFSGTGNVYQLAREYSFLTGYNPPYFGTCGDVELGPLVEDDYTGKEAWEKLIESRCSLADLPRVLLEIDDVRTQLSELCTLSSKQLGFVRRIHDTAWVRALRKRIPRACGLLTLVDGVRDQQRIEFNIPALPLASATTAFARRAKVATYLGYRAFAGCRNFIVGPVVGRFTRQEAWHKLTAPICADSGLVLKEPDKRPVYMVGHPWVAEHSISIFKADPQCSCLPAVGEPVVIEPIVVDAAIAMPSFAEASVAQPVVPGRMNLDTTVVTGNRELPKVLYIVPWKKSAPADAPAPFNTLLDEALTPLDRDVFRREVEYFETLSGRQERR